MFTYKNLYAYFISYVAGKGNETVIEYNRRSKVYKVTQLIGWNVRHELYCDNAFDAKKQMRDLIKLYY